MVATNDEISNLLTSRPVSHRPVSHRPVSHRPVSSPLWPVTAIPYHRAMVLADSGGVESEETAALLALVEAADQLPGIRRRNIAELVETWGGARAILDHKGARSPLAGDSLGARLVAAVTPGQVATWERRLAMLSGRHPEVSLVTIVDPTFPPGLRHTPSTTPFLFVRGQLLQRDARAMAIAGTRHPSPEGIEQAHDLSGAFVAAGITVVSGLAEGIDTAAHQGALASGGRTVAVLGHGALVPVYPPSNAALVHEIAHSGSAIVSQFWPWTPPSRQTFPQRNATSSALALGTVVVEAGERSGARLQADLCLRQGRVLFLPEHLVATEEWARRYAGSSGVRVFRCGTEVVDHLEHLTPVPRSTQLRFGEGPP